MHLNWILIPYAWPPVRMKTVHPPCLLRAKNEPFCNKPSICSGWMSKNLSFLGNVVDFGPLQPCPDHLVESEHLGGHHLPMPGCSLSPTTYCPVNVEGLERLMRRTYKKLNSKTGIMPPEFHGPICSYFSVSSNHPVKDSCAVLILGSDENIDQ